MQGRSSRYRLLTNKLPISRYPMVLWSKVLVLRSGHMSKLYT